MNNDARTVAGSAIILRILMATIGAQGAVEQEKVIIDCMADLSATLTEYACGPSPEVDRLMDFIMDTLTTRWKTASNYVAVPPYLIARQIVSDVGLRPEDTFNVVLLERLVQMFTELNA